MIDGAAVVELSSGCVELEVAAADGDAESKADALESDALAEAELDDEDTSVEDGEAEDVDKLGVDVLGVLIGDEEIEVLVTGGVEVVTSLLVVVTGEELGVVVAGDGDVVVEGAAEVVVTPVDIGPPCLRCKFCNAASTPKSQNAVAGESATQEKSKACDRKRIFESVLVQIRR